MKSKITLYRHGTSHYFGTSMLNLVTWCQFIRLFINFDKGINLTNFSKLILLNSVKMFLYKLIILDTKVVIRNKLLTKIEYSLLNVPITILFKVIWVNSSTIKCSNVLLITNYTYFKMIIFSAFLKMMWSIEDLANTLSYVFLNKKMY